MQFAGSAPGTGLRARTGRGRTEVGRTERIQALDPDLVDTALAPGREETNAVAAGEDVVELCLERCPRKILEHVLA